MNIVAKTILIGGVLILLGVACLAATDYNIKHGIDPVVTTF